MREMKDSGVEWIGDIAKDYSVCRLKFLLRTPLQYGANESGEAFSQDAVRYIRITDITLDGTLKNDENNLYLPSVVAKDYLLRDRDVLFARSGGTVGKSFLYRAQFGTSAFAGYLIKAECDTEKLLPEYLMMYTQSSLYELWKNMIFVQATIQNIGANRYANLDVTLPDIADQERIVEYLSNKCAQIDDLIANVQSQIEKLKQYKQSIITEVVTKGLDPSVPMKDSGVAWFGKVPAHWSISRVGQHCDIILGKMLCPEQPDDSYSLEPYFCAANIHFEGIDRSIAKTMWFNPKEKEQYLVKMGDLLIVEGGAGAGGCSVVSALDESVYVQNSVMIVREKKEADIRYIRYLVESLVKRGYIDLVCNKATIPHFTKEKLSAVPYPVLPVVEQNVISDYLDRRCAQIDQLIAIKQAKIDKLTAYKKSLIYEYVTGKKEVI